MKENPFALTAPYYDRIYSFKDYRAEAERLLLTIDTHKRSPGRRLLDVACGTGRHLEHLKAHFQCEGLDLSPEFLAITRQRNPELAFHQADMADFAIAHSFDVITCLFSSIGYLKTQERVGQSVLCMARHLVPGGVLLVEPWFTPESWHAGSVHALLVDDPELKIARVNTSLTRGRVSVLDFHYLIGTPQGTEHVVEHHELGLFETHELEDLFRRAGLEVTYDPDGPAGRGLFVGRKPLTASG